MLGHRPRGALVLAAVAAASSRIVLSAEFRPGDEPEWKRRMRDRLLKEVACGFRKTTLETAISALQRQTDIAFTLDARAIAESRGRRIEHRAEKDVLALALRSVLEQGGLDYVLRKSGIFISTRERIGEEGEIGNEPEWMFWIRKKLRRTISFEFVDTPLTESVQFFQTLTKINMILDPAAVKKRGNTPITLKVRNEPLRDAFGRVLEIAGFDYALIDEAVFISTRKRLARELDLDAAIAMAETASKGEKEPEWKVQIRRTLDRRLSFQLAETPLEEAVRFLQALTAVAFVVDPNAVRGRERMPITLRVSQMPVCLSCRSMLRMAGLRYALKDGAVWISTPENVLAELRRRAEPQAGRERPEREREFRKLLQRKVSFEFVDTPLSEAVQFMLTLCKWNMILDPRAVEMRGNAPINLKVSAMALEQALDWVLRLADLEYALKDGAIFISTPEIIAREHEAGLIPGSPTKTPPGLEDVF